ncbi:endonuclease [Halovenus sp. WSH3]|uniref:Endonuclease n=1 Tax=Halovenus carboxidivorans TaxID=2692199 RepID=A0A6B0T449_9EURY|nr:endonuclease/exonuclease/phosphatase family protein [Halovenus carboxidivorans]MXR50263.1 endonuclease [Halovenus carboxidivorans]
MDPVTVLSYNVRHAVLDDDEHAWRLRRDGVAERVRAAEPDILGVQECTGEQHEQLAADLPGYEWVGVAAEPGSGEHTPIGYADSWKCERTETIWLSESGDPGSVGWDAEYPRVLTTATLRRPANGAVLTVVNTHFDHVGERARLESARLARERIDALPADRPAVLLGDFNAEPGSEPYESLIGDGFDRALRDARIAARERAGPATTLTDFESSRERIVDHVFVTAEWQVDRYAVDDTRHEGAYPSDHLPVVVSLKR